MKRKFTFLLMALLTLAGFKSWGQESQTITIGTQADTNQDMPFNGYYNYSYAQMLYLGSEIGESGTITSISFYVNQGVSKDYTLDVYMKCVDKSEFSYGDDWVSVTTEDLVYQTEFFRASSTGWNTITLSKPFQYNSDQNLMIAFDNNTGSYSAAHNFGVSYNGATGLYQRDDNLNISPFDPYGGTLAYYRPIIQITMLPAQGNTINYATLTGGTISGPSKAEEGATVTLSATPAHGYDFVADSWVVTKSTGGTVDVINNQFTMPDCDVTVSATFTAQQSYTVNITNPTDGLSTTATLSATPSTNVLEGDEVRLNYSDLAEGYKFVNYVATNASTSEPVDIQQKWDGSLWQYYYCFTMPDADVNLTASVKLIRTINVAEMQHGNLYLNPNPQNDQIVAGETITISPNPDYGYELENLTITKVSGGTITPVEQEQWGQIIYTFEMPEDDVNIAATFASSGTLYTVTLPEETEIGRVSAYPADEWESSTEYFENDNVRLNVYVKNSNYHIKDVVVKKDSDQTVVDFYEQSGDYYYFIMPADNVTVTVTFEENPRYLVSIGTTENGTVSLIDAPADNKYYEGQQVKFNVTPDAGYMINEVTYSCGQTVNIWYDSYWGYYYFTMPEAAVTINASFVVGITVHDGTDYSENTPILGSYTDAFNTKSQFIFPAAELTAVKDTKITDLIFYTQNVGSNNFSSMTWDIFMKEVDYITPSSFANWNDMTNVYNGTITISNNKLTIHLSTPFEYNGGNLMIGFRENEHGATYFYTQWSGDFSNYDAYHSIATNIYEQPEQSCFLPKTTIIYEPIVKNDITLTPPATEVGTIQALANGVEVVGQVSEGTEITLQYNFNLGYRFLNWIVNGEPIQGNTFTMPATAVTVAVNYETLTPYAISCATIEHGEILAQFQGATITGAYEGMQIDLVANLDEGYAVTDWTVNGQPIEGSSFIMPAINVNVNATVIQRLEFTVYEDGTATNSNVPIYGLYADYYRTQSEFIIPKEDLTALKDAQITGMTFYSSNIENHDFGLPYWKVFVKEVNKTNASIPYEDETTMTEVYLGTMKVQGYELTVSFASPITYTGNNLMIMFDQQSNSAEFKSINWYGITTASNTALASNFNNFYEDDYFQFLPKTTFAYIPAPQYEVTLLDVENGTIGADPMEAAAGATIQLTATPAEHYRFGSWITTPEVEIDENNQFVMPEGGVTVSATFLPLSQYQINFMANGVTDGSQTYEEGATIDKVPTEVPSGMTFAGWVAEDIATFTEQAPVYTTTANQAMTLYAVFSYTDDNGGIVWNKVTDVTTLANNDQIIIACETNNRVLCQRAQGGLTCQAEAVTIENGQIANISNNAIVFTLESSTGNQWHLNFNDNFDGNTSIAALNTYLAPITSYPSFNNEWVISENGIQNVGDDSYISYVYLSWKGELSYFGTDFTSANAAQIFKRGFGSKTYYMTEVFFVTEDMSVTEDMTKKNIAIVNDATLTIKADATLNATGLCLNTSHDATKLVVEDGGQLIHNNTGTVATMKKHINGTNNWYTISSPLAADETAFADVTNLIPGNDVSNTSYDLYYLNEKDGVWVNARPETGQSSSFTKIEKGVGYIYSNTNTTDIAFAGEINVAPVKCTLTNGAAHGFNLIGNPFTQNITLANVTGTAELADGFYVLNNDETWGTKLTESEIKPLQGFLVQATEEGGTARISKNASVRGERSKEQSTNIEMIVSNASFKDNAYAMFGEGTGLNKVSHRNAQAPMLYVPQDGEDFAIAFMDENTTIFPLSFKAMTTGSYSISLKPTDDVSTLVLVDNMTGAETNMLLEESYTFIGSPADNENRFTVKFEVSYGQDGDGDGHFAYQNGSELVINGEGTLQIFDVLGRMVISEEVHGQTVNVGGLNTGAYIVRLTGESVKTQKIVVR